MGLNGTTFEKKSKIAKKDCIMVMKLNFLTENSAKRDSHLLAEHGLSIYIECDNLKLIFDTGDTDIYLKNA